MTIRRPQGEKVSTKLIKPHTRHTHLGSGDSFDVYRIFFSFLEPFCDVNVLILYRYCRKCMDNLSIIFISKNDIHWHILWHIDSTSVKPCNLKWPAHNLHETLICGTIKTRQSELNLTYDSTNNEFIKWKGNKRIKKVV